MHKNKLYSILTHFDKIEQNRLRKYIISPYFNKNESLIALFEELIDHINKGNKQEIDKQKIWQKLFTDTSYEDARYRKLFSDLLKLVEGFLAQEVYEENPLNKAVYLMEAVGKKKMEKLYKSTMNTAKRLSQNQFYRDADYYFNQYLVQKKYYELTRSDLDRKSKTNIEEIINNLDRFYFGEKLKYYCEVLIRQVFISHEYKLLFIDEIINHVNQHKYEEVPPIAVYFQGYLTQFEPENEEHYFKLKSILEKFGTEFSKEEAKEIYKNANNYCIYQINKGNRKFLEEFLELNEDLLKKGILTEGELSPWRFQNIVFAALRLGKYQWTQEFINKYKYKLSPEFRDNAVSFNLARLYFYEKKYDKVVFLLHQVEYEDVSYNLASKAMLLITYYETDELEPLDSLMESFRAFLNRHKEISIQRRNSYMNLIRTTKKLTNFSPGDKKNIEKIKTEVSSSKGIVNKEWLLEKIAELG